MLSKTGFIAALLLSVLMGLSTACADKRIALIVGNSAYQNVAPLANPVNDAEAIAGLLRISGFDVVTSRNNLGNLDFKRSLREFTLAARDADIALVYFAGHGIEVKGTNYLVPVDAKLASDYDAEDEAVSLNRIIDAIEPARRLRVIILDACRDNPFSKTMQRTIGSRAVAAGLAKVEPSASNFLIAYAAKAGSTADDGKGVHSPFTAALLNHLGTPGLEVGKAFRQVRDEVLKNTRNRQEPFVYSSLGGEDFSLVPAAPAPVPAINMQAEVRHDYELAAQIGTKEVWDQFLAVYNTGFYATLARSALNKIIAEEARAVAAAKAEVNAKAKAEAQAKAVALKAEAEAKARAKADAKAEVAAKEKTESEQATKLEAERKRLAIDQEARDRQERERLDRERLAKENASRAKAEREQASKAEAERNRLAREQTDRDKAETKVTVLEPSAGQSPARKHAIDAGALVKEIKKELKRVGCYEGAIDDNWSTFSTKASLGKFGKFATLSTVPRDPTTDLLDAIRGKFDRVCPLECGSREIEQDGLCVAKSATRASLSPEAKQDIEKDVPSSAQCKGVISRYRSGVTPKTLTPLQRHSALYIFRKNDGRCGWGTENNQETVEAAKTLAYSKCKAFENNSVAGCTLAGVDGHSVDGKNSKRTISLLPDTGQNNQGGAALTCSDHKKICDRKVASRGINPSASQCPEAWRQCMQSGLWHTHGPHGFSAAHVPQH